MKKLLLVQPSLQLPGGGQGVAAWIIEALKGEYAVHVLRWRPVDLEPINRYYGTSFMASDFTEHGLHPLVRFLVDLVPLPLVNLRCGLQFRFCKKRKDDFAVIISTDDVADFGRRGIQYVHYPYHYRPRPPVDLRWHPLLPLVRAYFWFCRLIYDYSVEGMKQNLTLVNSDWVGDKVKEVHGIETTTLHPPIAGDFPEVPWKDRENGFVCIGRIAPEKELEKVIDILASLRAQGHDVHLHIIGSRDHKNYYARICRLALENDSWVFLNEDISRDELVRLVTTHRYGIHGMTEEHFGMAVGEMVRGGCIAFVPDGGGQVEIVGNESDLRYQTVEDAVEKIDRVLGDPALQARLKDYLSTRKDLFSAEHFVHEIRKIVVQWDSI